MNAAVNQSHYEELSRSTVAALAAYHEAADRLARTEVEGRSSDDRVVVRVTASGVNHVRLRKGALQRYTPAALSDAVTRTIRDAQRRAREAMERELAVLVPKEVDECRQVVEDLLRSPI